MGLGTSAFIRDPAFNRSFIKAYSRVQKVETSDQWSVTWYLCRQLSLFVGYSPGISYVFWRNGDQAWTGYRTQLYDILNVVTCELVRRCETTGRKQNISLHSPIRNSAVAELHILCMFLFLFICDISESAACGLIFRIIELD